MTNEEKPVVIVVDDEGSWRDSVRTFFTVHGHRCNSASNLDSAMRVFHQYPNDQMIGFVDINMQHDPKGGLDIIQYGHEFVPHRAALYAVTGNNWSLALEAEVLRRGGLELLIKDPETIFERMLLRVENPTVLDQYSNSWRDPLTNLKRLPAFKEDVLLEITDMKERKRWDTIHLAILDMRNFKHINDTYGHLVGDRCLRHVADIIRSKIRPKDYSCRYGGDEFLICMAGASRKKALQTSAAIQTAVANSPVEAREGVLIPLSLDWGVAELERKHISYPIEPLFTELMRKADERMYISKRAAKEAPHEDRG